MYINIESKREVVHSLLLARLEMLWIRLIWVVDKLEIGGCGYLGFELWITILIGVSLAVMDIPTFIHRGYAKKA